MTQTMRAMVLEQPRQSLRLRELPVPQPNAGEVLVRVSACAVCRTDLHVMDGELPNPKLPLVLGHEIVGKVEALGSGLNEPRPGARIGIPWLGYACGVCKYCRSDRENLCADAQFTGYHRDGGYAEYCLADPRFCFPIPESYSDLNAAPLLCAGLIGYRALRAAGDAQRIGLYGFGAAAHILAQIIRHQGREAYAFVRPGDEESRRFALDLGVEWAGYSDQPAPRELDAAIIFAPVGALVPVALQAVARGGVVVCAGIHMSDIPTFPYAWLWGERVIRSVANLTRRDGVEFFELASRIPLRTEVKTYRLEEANEALEALRTGRLRGAAVLRIAP